MHDERDPGRLFSESMDASSRLNDYNHLLHDILHSDEGVVKRIFKKDTSLTTQFLSSSHCKRTTRRTLSL